VAELNFEIRLTVTELCTMFWYHRYYVYNSINFIALFSIKKNQTRTMAMGF
jgi:hypothetical protein